MADQEVRQIEPLKVLYDGGLATLRSLSERSFTTTLQAITLDVAVVAGLIGSKAELSLIGKSISCVLLLLFNAFIIGYLISKARAHHREKKQFITVQSAIRQLSELNCNGNEENEVSFWRSFFGGSGLFIVSVTLAGAVAASALWVPMLTSSNAHQANPSLQQDVPQGEKGGRPCNHTFSLTWRSTGARL
jgi:hypothetical protein